MSTLAIHLYHSYLLPSLMRIMAELTREQELEAAVAEAWKRYHDAVAANASEAIQLALIDDIKESGKHLEREREREREFLRRLQDPAAAAPPSNPMRFLYKYLVYVLVVTNLFMCCACCRYCSMYRCWATHSQLMSIRRRRRRR